MSQGKISLNNNLNILRRKIVRQIQNSELETKLGYSILEKLTSAIIICEFSSSK